jgi:hypothetical protein
LYILAKGEPSKTVFLMWIQNVIIKPG